MRPQSQQGVGTLLGTISLVNEVLRVGLIVIFLTMKILREVKEALLVLMEFCVELMSCFDLLFIVSLLIILLAVYETWFIISSV